MSGVQDDRDVNNRSLRTNGGGLTAFVFKARDELSSAFSVFQIIDSFHVNATKPLSLQITVILKSRQNASFSQSYLFH